MRSFLFYMGFLEVVMSFQCRWLSLFYRNPEVFPFIHKTITIWFYTNGNYIVWKGRIRRELLE